MTLTVYKTEARETFQRSLIKKNPCVFKAKIAKFVITVMEELYDKLITQKGVFLMKYGA